MVSKIGTMKQTFLVALGCATLAAVTAAHGQNSVSTGTKTAIFYDSAEEKKIAEASKEKLAHSGKFKKPIVTEILPSMKFYPAEAYHQKYYQQNPEHFEAFEEGSGRVSFKKKNWVQ